MEGQKSSWTSRTLTFVHPGVKVYACVCALMWLSLLATLHFEIRVFQCNMQLGDMLPLPKTITCWVKHRSRVMEEHRCLWNQGLINTEGCITVQTEVSLHGAGESGPKLFTTLCYHKDDQLWRFLFFFHSQKCGLLQGKKKTQTSTLFHRGFLLRLVYSFPRG